MVSYIELNNVSNNDIGEVVRQDVNEKAAVAIEQIRGKGYCNLFRADAASSKADDSRVLIK